MKKKYIIYSVLAALIVGLSVFAFTHKTPEKIINTTRGAVMEGRLQTSATDTSEKKETYEDGGVKFSLNKNVFFDVARCAADLMFENPPENEYDLQLFIYIKGKIDSSPIYTSPKLSPGQYINGDSFSIQLDSGKYDCVYIVRAYSGTNVVTESADAMTVTVS